MIISKYTGTQTEKNLHAAFACESQARNKYVYFSSVAKKESFAEVARKFRTVDEIKKRHEERYRSLLKGEYSKSRTPEKPVLEKNVRKHRLKKTRHFLTF